jgi:hypothetical protein
MLKFGLMLLICFIGFLEVVEADQSIKWIQKWRGCVDTANVTGDINKWWNKKRLKEDAQKFCKSSKAEVKPLEDWRCSRFEGGAYCGGQDRFNMECSRTVKCGP